MMWTWVETLYLLNMKRWIWETVFGRRCLEDLYDLSALDKGEGKLRWVRGMGMSQISSRQWNRLNAAFGKERTAGKRELCMELETPQTGVASFGSCRYTFDPALTSYGDIVETAIRHYTRYWPSLLGTSDNWDTWFKEFRLTSNNEIRLVFV